MFVEKYDIFWSEIGSGFGEPGSPTPLRITRSIIPEAFSVKWASNN